MDCSRFIRSKTVLAAWLAVPFLLVLLTALSTRGFHRRQQTANLRNQTLLTLIPEMEEDETDAENFLNVYRIQKQGLSIQEIYAELIDDIATETQLPLSSVNIEQKTVDTGIGTAKVIILLEGRGTFHQIANFLHQAKKKDPLLFESSLSIKTAGGRSRLLTLKTELIRIYVE